MPAHQTTINSGNPFKTALGQQQAQIGFWLSMANSYCAEMCATAGFPWLLIDNEHAPNNLNTTLAQLQAITAYGGHAVVRPVQGDPASIKQLLDIGAQTLLVPMIDTPEQAAAMVAATRYPPHGIRGVGAGVARVSRWNARPDYVHQANEEVCLLVQAETTTALQHLESICAIDGVDGVFIGPADLAASMGHLGNPGHPDVQAAIEDAIQRIVATGKAAGTLTGDVEQARRFLALGATFVAVGLDVTLMMQAVRQRAADFGIQNPLAPEACLQNNAAY